MNPVDNNRRGAAETKTYSSDFLAKTLPSTPKPIISKIDFEASGIPQYAGAYALVIDDLFTAEECTELVSLASQANNNVWERALVNIGGGRQASYPDIRNCGRIIFDSPQIADRIWKRVTPHISDILRIERPAGKTKTGLPRKGYVRVANGLNERLRFLRYGPGEFFERHCDGCYRRTALDGSGDDEFSLYTLHLYLNDGFSDGENEDPKPLVGGSTTFFSPWSVKTAEKELRVKPKVGRVLVFQQAELMHSGEEVLAGLKLTMRTDIMYKQLPAV